MNINITVKQFILICFVILTVVFFFAFQNLTSAGQTSTITVKMNSTAPSSQLQVSGANIIGLERLTPESHIDYSPKSVFFNKTGVSNINVRLKTQEGPVRFTLLKDPRGTASAQISGVGLLENNHESVSVPVHITTNASVSKIRFSGITVAGMDASKTTGKPYVLTWDSQLITINNTAGNQIDIDLNLDVSFDEDLGIITLEKSDDGIFSVDIAGYRYANDRTGAITLHNVPFTVEMTSNQSEIRFNEASIVKAKVINSDLSSQSLILGENFIYISHSGDLDNFHKLNFLLDLNFPSNSSLTIIKPNEGFVNAHLGGTNYFSIGSTPGNAFNTQTYSITDIPTEEKKTITINSPLIIETTSDWTDITFEGLENPQYFIKGFDGYIDQPEISGNTISIKKKTTRDTTFAQVRGTIQASGQNNPRIIIEKGDIGSTTVILGEKVVFLNGDKIARDSRNRVSFDIPPFSKDLSEGYEIYQNPVSSIFPSVSILNERGLTPADTQSKEESIAISSSDLPGFKIGMKRSVAEGVIAFVFISYALLGILLLSLLIREGFFSFLPERKFSLSTLWTLLTGTLERMAISSTFIVETLIVLATTPFLLMTNEAMAEYAAILAYLLLVAGVILKLLEMKEMIRMEKSKEMFIKIDSIAILLAAGFIAAFELRTTSVGLLGILGMVGVTLVFLAIAFIYMNRDLHE